MAFYDIYNGDADGLCALQQLRLAFRRESALVTGAKRDIALLSRVAARPGDELVVLDIAVAANRPDLDRVLAAGARVDWFDHHMPGPMPQHPAFRARVDTSPQVCTSVLVDRHLQGGQRRWAVVGAFGDNMADTARALGDGLGDGELSLMQRLGEAINYNAYGDSADELRFHPAELHLRMRGHADPARFAQEDPVLATLEATIEQDMKFAQEVRPVSETPATLVLELPDAAWSRRVSGLLANRLASAHPARAHALLTPSRNKYTVSIRAPLQDLRGADQVASRFAGGGGRAGAAGINGLPASEVPRLIAEFQSAYARA